ncbi:MAG TPA: hypothetical protein VHE33_05020 [Acidobacteriaceae bacterium]|nr:hypothetical protein [Acidobacteriaceae bacterium]
MRFSVATLRPLLLTASAAALAISALAQPIPAATAIPIVLTKTITAGQAHPGDPIAARTLQAVLLPGARLLPAGTLLTGHIVTASPFHFDATPYAAQQPSTLSIHFDAIEHGSATPVSLSLRAIAGSVASHEAQVPHLLDETDGSNTRELIGGETASPLDKTIQAPDGTIVGYNRTQGLFAHLLAAASPADPNLTCNATSTEQSLGLFSADACGVYGLNAVSLANNGVTDGTFLLESRQRSVQLDAGTTALLEVLSR